MVGVSSRRRPPRPAAVRQAPRRVRLNELLRIADERLELVSVTAIDVDNDLNRAIVYFDSLAGEAGDAEVLEALEEHRRALQRAIGRQIHARKTPVLEFRPDDVIRSAERIERILRELPPTPEGDDRPT